MQKVSTFLFFLSLFTVFGLYTPTIASAQTCDDIPTSSNTLTSTFTLPEDNTYTVWTRIFAPDSTNNSIWLQVDGGCAINVGDASAITADSFTWVNYKDGSTGSTITMDLTAGEHTIKLTQREGGVGIDRVIFTTNTDCIPTGTGENCPVPTNTPTPTTSPLSASIIASASAGTKTVGTPFTIDVAVDGGGRAFNAAQATVAISSNLSLTGVSTPPSNACNFTYTGTAPSTGDPSFVGAILSSSSTSCIVYRLTLNPLSAGTGTITFSNGSVKAYNDNSEILSAVTNGSYTISAAPTATSVPTTATPVPSATTTTTTATPTPTPTPQTTPTSQPSPSPTTSPTTPTITSAALSYAGAITLTGTKTANIVSIYVNGSTAGVTYPNALLWRKTLPLTLGNNIYTVYGVTSDNIQTETVTGTVTRNKRSDINGDNVIDLTDLSLFGVDWLKTSNLNKRLSDMNEDGIVNLTDFSILAKNYGN